MTAPDCRIQTFTGRMVDPLNVDPTTLHIDDIAHALSHVNRFTGHTRKPYSVGLHSLTVCRLVKKRGGTREAQLWALLHDATEAYLADIAAPVKAHPMFDAYRAAEHSLGRSIAERFMPSFADDLDANEVKRADWDMLLAERKNVLPPGGWNAPVAPSDACEAFKWGQLLVKPELTQLIFLDTFDLLGGVR